MNKMTSIFHSVRLGPNKAANLDRWQWVAEPNPPLLNGIIWIGAVGFIVILALSAVWDPTIRWLHFFQALMYIAVIALTARGSRWGPVPGGFGRGVLELCNDVWEHVLPQWYECSGTVLCRRTPRPSGSDHCGVRSRFSFRNDRGLPSGLSASFAQVLGRSCGLVRHLGRPDRLFRSDHGAVPASLPEPVPASFASARAVRRG
jgi:hypothetical protein